MKVAYHGDSFRYVGSDFRDINKVKKIINADVLDAWYDPSPKVVKKIKDHVPWIVRTAPPIHGKGLISTISKVRHIPENNIIIGGGSSDLIYLSLYHLLNKNSKVVILDPMYGEYSHLIEQIGIKPINNFQNKENGFTINHRKIVENSNGADMIILVNPNNPTSQLIKKDTMKLILDSIDQSTILFVDETYVDFSGTKNSIETRTSKYSNLVVLKSMSKFYALSGARVAYLSASGKIIDKLRNFSPPWSVSLFGQIAGIEALKDEKYYRRKVAETHKLRKKFSADLSSINGLKIYDSAANFILMEILNKKTAPEVCEKMKKKNIYIRNCDSQSLRFKSNFIRTAVKDERSNLRIFRALKEIIEK